MTGPGTREFWDAFFAFMHELIRDAAQQASGVSRQTERLRAHTRSLEEALAPYGIVFPETLLTRRSDMPHPTLDALSMQVTATAGVIDSAVLLIGGIADRIQAAVTAALANGATAEELAPVQGEVDLLRQKTDALAAAIAANTPTP